MSGRLELSEAKLGNAEAQVEDLKLQLDDALGAEDLLEQLTDRNLQLSEVSTDTSSPASGLDADCDAENGRDEGHY